MNNENGKKNNNRSNQQKMIRRNGYKIMTEKHKNRPDKRDKEKRRTK